MLGGHWGTSVPAGDIVDTPIWWLDAGNPASYPGTGTVWTDLMGNFHFNAENTVSGGGGVLLASDGTTPMWDAGRGSLRMDGTNSWQAAADYAGSWLRHYGDTVSPSTVEFWVKAVDASYQIIMGSAGFGGGHWGATINFASGPGGSYRPYIGGSYFDDVMPVSVWIHFAVAGLADGASPLTLYLNGARSGTVKTGSNAFTGDSSDRPRLGHTGHKNYGSTYGMVPGTRCAVVRGYDRILSAAEIAQNFDAERARFGV